MEQQELKYLKLLAEKFPTIQEVCTEIINLKAIQNLPKSTEHFLSDLHGEYESFLHILKNIYLVKLTFLFCPVSASVPCTQQKFEFQ